MQTYSFGDLERNCPPELMAGNAFSQIFDKFVGQEARTKYGPHLALFDALAMTLLHPENLKVPAGIDRHGGRSLLTHTLLLCSLMIQRAPVYVYVPAFGTAAIDPAFKLDPNDPLILVLGMAHDLGKIRKMVLSSAGKALSLHPGHASQSAREMAQLEEFWSKQISVDERRIIQCALVYSDRLKDCPIQKMEQDGHATVTSDRLHALMRLMAECDRIASAIEMGGNYAFNDQPKIVAIAPEDLPTMETIDLFNELSRFMMEMTVNARSPQRSVGFKRHDEIFSRGRHILIIDEKEFVQAFSVYLRLPNAPQPEGKSYALTAKVLELLDEKGLLFRIAEEGNFPTRAAKNCLYEIKFRNAGAPLSAEPTMVLKSSFIIDVTDWSSMTKIQGYPSCLSTPTFGSYKIGRQPAMQRASAEDSILAESFTGVIKQVGTDITTLQSQGASKKRNKSEVIIDKIGRSLLSRNIQIGGFDENSIAIVGYDEFFVNLGIAITHYDELPEKMSKLGIIKINKSIKDPSVHVVRLDKTVYKKYLVNHVRA